MKGVHGVITKGVLCFALGISSFMTVMAQGSAGDEASIETRYIVDMPTAGVIPKSTFALNTFFFPAGGAMMQWSFAPFTNINLGVSFGGTGIIGNENIKWQRHPGFHFRLRIVDESLRLPAVLLGIGTQGRGPYLPDDERFQIQSPGIYAAASKSFSLLGEFALHGGLNYSFEPIPSARRPNFFVGSEKSIGNIISLHLEFNSTLNANESLTLEKRGLLNAAIRGSFGKGFTVELQLQDLLSSYRDAQHPTRSIAIEYISEW